MAEKNQKESNGRGGRRPNAGRPPGSATKKTRLIAEKAMAEGVTPLEYMLSIMRRETTHEDPKVEVMRESLAFEAAKAAAPYIHPRLAAVEHSGPGGGPIEGHSVLDISGLSMEQMRAIASIRLNGE